MQPNEPWVCAWIFSWINLTLDTFLIGTIQSLLRRWIAPLHLLFRLAPLWGGERGVTWSVDRNQSVDWQSQTCWHRDNGFNMIWMTNLELSSSLSLFPSQTGWWYGYTMCTLCKLSCSQSAFALIIFTAPSPLRSMNKLFIALRKAHLCKVFKSQYLPAKCDPHDALKYEGSEAQL